MTAFETVSPADIKHAATRARGRAAVDMATFVGAPNAVVAAVGNKDSARNSASYYRRLARTQDVVMHITWAELADGRYVVIANPDFGGAS